MKALLKKMLRLLFGDYAPYFIYASPAQLPVSAPSLRVAAVDRDRIAASADALIREQAGYAGEGAHAFACFDGERIVGVCFYWHGARYLTRNFWPLRDGEAKLVQIITLPEMRGRQVAQTLIAASVRELGAQGWQRAYARIWHSNTPSLRAFEKAGWRKIALVLELYPFARKKPLRLTYRF